jgi:hypothetical protein
MNVDVAVAQLCAEDLVPPTVLRRVADRARFLDEVARYAAMEDDELHRATEVCLRNLERLDSEVEYELGPDARLRHVLVPELWERVRPGSRDALRRISTTLAEYDPDTDRPSFWRRSRLWSAEREVRLRSAAARLRDDVACTARVDAGALVEQARFAIAGSRAADRWPPDRPVYEPGFTYRLVPAVAWRVLVRARVRDERGQLAQRTNKLDEETP